MSILKIGNSIVLFVSLATSITYFIFLKKKLIHKSDFKISSSRLMFEKTEIMFNSVKEYKIRWMSGAELKLVLKNGKKIRWSSNENFCDSTKFVSLCEEIESTLSKPSNSGVIHTKSFYETKYGYYFAIFITGFFLIITIYKYIIKDDFRLMNFLMITILLGIIWSGVKLKKER